jgi:hypothetical protein
MASGVSKELGESKNNLYLDFIWNYTNNIIYLHFWSIFSSS